MRRTIRTSLKFVTKIVSKIPSKEDTVLQKIAKILSIGDEIYSLAGGNPIDDFQKEKGLIKTRNGVLIDLLFSSLLLEEFKQDSIKLEEHRWGEIVSALKLEHPELGELYFIERKYTSGDAFKDMIILHKQNFDFQKLMEKFWTAYDGKLYITFSQSGISCSEFPSEKLNIYGKNAETARDLAIQHMKYADAKISRSYLFLGNPGTGKSSCAMLFASKMSKKILKIEASALVSAGKGLRFLLQLLKPDFVLIDDIDKDREVDKYMSSVLSSIEWIKMSNPDVTIVFTANDIHRLDKAFWRPGRVDSITVFEEPSKEDRTQIIKGFIEQFQVVLPSGVSVTKIVEETESLSPVWLKEIVLRFKYDDPENVIAVCRQMHDIINQTNDNDGETLDNSQEKTPPPIIE